MKRILFGRRAVKQTKKEESSVTYAIGSIVLGNFFKETPTSIKFKLPNRKIAVCYKEYMREEISEIFLEKEQGGINRFFVEEFDPHLYVELLILGEREGTFECTFFTQKVPVLQSLVTGIIRREEEVGYTVEIGLHTKQAVLKTDKTYVPGDLALFQVLSVSPSLYVLTDTLEREVYIGEKNEITVGLLLRTKITGRPKYVTGETRASFTNLPYKYTAEALGVCTPIVESGDPFEIDDEMKSIIVYVSEDKETIHAVPYDEYVENINRRVPKLEAIGDIHQVKVLSQRNKTSYVVEKEDGEPGILTSIHYSDLSSDKEEQIFNEGDSLKCRIFSIQGYTIFYTAKEALIHAELPEFPLQKGDVLLSVARRITERGVICETFGGSTITIRKDTDELFYLGKIYKVRITAKGERPNLFLGRREEALPLGRSDSLLSSSRSIKFWEKATQFKNIRNFTNGDIVDAEIYSVYQYGAFAYVEPGISARIKISEISSRFVQEWQSLVHVGQRTKLVLYDIDYDEGKVEGSIKKYEVLQMVTTKEEETEEVETNTPLVYAKEQEEESSEEEEDDEEFQMELFNSKDGSTPWTKRISTLPPIKAVSLWRSSLERVTSPETKRTITLHLLSTLSSLSKEQLHPSIPIEEIITEGVKREGSSFLKKSMDNCRNSSNQEIFLSLCKRYISEKKDSTFGYKEYIHYIVTRNPSLISTVPKLLNESLLKASEKKEIDTLYVEALYKISKEQGRIEIEKRLSENKQQSEWAIKYASLEADTITKQADVIYLRNILDKSIFSMGLPQTTAKNLFKTYLKLEKDFGTPQTQQKVLEAAKRYVSEAE
ncbi:hypothetical protein NEFER03_1728 [Nematocida sp. LUAm3]|nr:hypothetical protein NEFER03_1728 [Nematocida sp. LUAm3]KAI5175718.1 hypothetical protein NEFER02_1605 [Nematocida sp. LUAm2]KAI5178624.1 hypothetical protein NEFER01_1760 [Nematocida sp. LUAm1]